MTITIESRGRRHYLRGNTYPIRDAIREADYAAKVHEAGGAEEYAEQRAERSGVCRGCRGPIQDAGHHAAMGGYCGSCAFDEYDC